MTVRKDEARILSAKLKNRGNEMLCGAFCNLLSVAAAAGKEDQVRASIDEGCGLFGTVMQHLHQVEWKIRLCAERGDQSGCFRSVLGTLEHHCIACSERGDERDHR